MKLRAFISLSLFLGTVWAQPQTIRDPSLTPDQIRTRIESWPECDEYKSAERCKVTIYLGATAQPNGVMGPWMPHAHWDVQVKPFIFISEQPRGEAVVVLRQSSPFMQCTVAATPAAPTRDLSANIGTLLTAVGAVGAVPPGMNAELFEDTVTAAAAAASEQLSQNSAIRALASATLQQIEREIGTISDKLNSPGDAYHAYRKAVKDDWNYTFNNDEAAKKAIEDLKSKTAAALVAPFPDFANYEKQLGSLSDRLKTYSASAPPTEQSEIATDTDLLTRLLAEVSAAALAIKDETARRKTMRQLYDLLWQIDQNSALTMQVAPMAYFSGKTVTETVTCKDVISNNPAFDNIIFTAYYEGLPHFDISAGAVFSLLGGRQVGTLTPSWTPAQQSMCNAQLAAGSAAPCGPGTLLGYTTKSWYQFMPGVFVEWRVLNFLPHWVKNGSPVHKVGYLWSFGPVAGVDINPNNGTTAAEFFEGVSLGIQRFAIMAGFHDGRYQQYGGGYYVGESFPAGATVTPPTVRNWAVRPAFGIAYRIPIR